MALEIMQLQKYDAKEHAGRSLECWGNLIQLFTGTTPFTGNNQIQLLQNIMKSTELQFPSDCPSLSFECKDFCQKLAMDPVAVAEGQKWMKKLFKEKYLLHEQQHF